MSKLHSIQAHQTISDMQHLGVLVDSISGALYSPSDSIGGRVANTLSPAVAYEIGQYFKTNELANSIDGGNRPQEGSPQHILAQTILAGLTANIAGNDTLSAALSAGGSEALAPALSHFLYGTTNPSELDAGQKQTLSAILSLGSVGTTLATGGSTTDAVSSGVGSSVAVEDNRLFLKGNAEQQKQMLAILQKMTNQPLTINKETGEVITSDGINLASQLTENLNGDPAKVVAALVALQALGGDTSPVVETFINSIINDKTKDLYISPTATKGTGGWFDKGEKTIFLLTMLTEAQKAGTLYHEIAHALLAYNPQEAVNYGIDTTKTPHQFPTAEAFADNQIKNEAYAEMTRYNLYNSLSPEEQKLVEKPNNIPIKDGNVFESAKAYLSDSKNISLTIRDKNNIITFQGSHYDYYKKFYNDTKKGATR